MNDYTKISVHSDPQAEELLIAVLLNEGAAGTQVDGGDIPDISGFDYICEDEFAGQPYIVSAYFPPECNIPSKIESIKYALDFAKNDNPGIEFGSLEIETETVHEEDWANNWKKYFKPQKVSARVVIKPSWEDYTAQKDDVVIELDPGMAFGTGTHETTRMCIQMLEEYMEEGAVVLDIGCGSGILSVAAVKLGAKRVTAVDLDPVAVRVTNENINMNGVQDNVEVFASDITEAVPEGKKYDVILANIIADIIIRLNGTVREYLKKPGIYICSGIIEERLGDVVSSLTRHGLKIIKIHNMGDWCAVVCKNK